MKLAQYISPILLIATLLLPAGFLYGQLASYTFTGAAGNEAVFPIDTQPANATVSDISRGPTVLPASLADGFNASQWPIGGVDNNDYYEFTIVPHAGYNLTLTSIALDEIYNNPTGNHTYNWVLRSSLDNFTTNIDQVFSTTTTGPTAINSHNIDLTGGTYDNIITPITFRLYAYSVSQSNQEWGIDSLVISGSLDTSQTIIHVIDFETLNYLLSTPLGADTDSFWGAFQPANHGVSHEFATGPPAGTQRTTYLAYRDGTTIGPQTMTTDASIDVSSYENLILIFSLANASLHDGYDTDDIVSIEYQYDGDGYQLLTQWAGEGDGTYMSEDADATGGGDGVLATELGPLFKTFERTLPKAGSLLDIRVSVTTTEEDVVIDNIAITGDLDITPPAVPTALDLAAEDDTGASNTDNITNSPSNLTISGIGEDGSAISLTSSTDGVLAGTATVTGGIWTMDISLSENNAHSITATATDLAGNSSAASSPLNIVVDTTPPAPPGEPDLHSSDDTGISNSDNITQTISGLSLSGFAELDATITLVSDIVGPIPGSATASASSWTLDIDLSDNATHSITAIATDVAGNSSLPSTAIVIVTDNTVSPPGTLDLAAADDTGASDSDNITQLTSGLTISGSGETGATITFTSDVDGPLIPSTSVTGGVWTTDIALSNDETHSLTAIQTDLAGNISTASVALVIITDTQAPASPSLQLSDIDDTGTSNTDNLTNISNGLTINGAGDDTSIISLSSNVDGLLASGIGPIANLWSVDINLSPNHTHLLTAEAYDIAGNSSTATLSLTVDTTPPPAPTSLDLDSSDDSGINNDDNITNLSNGLSISGTGENGSVASLTSSIDGVLTPTALVSGNNWVLDIDLTSNTNHSLTARSVDAAGNISEISNSLNVTIDDIAPILTPNEISLDAPTTLTFTLSEPLSVIEGAFLNGFSTTNGTLSSATYSGKGSTNTITLTGINWNASTAVSYLSGPGNVEDVAGNSLGDFGPQTVVVNTVNLQAGDIAFTGYLGDNNTFSFVLLSDIEAGTKVKFTDNGWTDNNAFTTQENTLDWSTPVRLFAGTEVVISPGLSASIGTASGTDLNLHLIGDQILAYQGSPASPTFIAAIHMNGDWNSFTNSSDQNMSNIPLGLTDQVDAIALSPETDNATYDYGNFGRTGSPTVLLSSINGSDSRWAKNDAPGAPSITFPTAGDNYIIPPDIVSLYPANGSTVAGTTPHLQIEFNVPIVKSVATGNNIQLRKADNSLVQSWDVNDSEVTISGDILAIDLGGVTLEHATAYRVVVHEWTIEDSFGNHNTAINLGEWEFTVDAEQPFVTAITLDPSVSTNGSTTNGLVLGNEARFIVTFNEPVNGIDATDFETNAASAGFTGTISVSGMSTSEYLVTVSNIDNEPGDLGTLMVNFINTDITDDVGNSGASLFNGSQFFTIIKDEPTNHITAMNATAGGDNFSIDLSWTPPASGILPDGYLVEITNTGSFGAVPIDQAPVIDDLDISDGYGVVNTTFNTITINNLISASTYTFRVFPYTNSASNIDYKTNGIIPQASAITNRASGTALFFSQAPSSLSATHNSVTDPEEWSLVFQIRDDFTQNDNVPTRFHSLILTAGAGNDFPDLAELLSGALLSDGLSDIAASSITNNTIVFNGIPNNTLGELGFVEDNQSRHFGIRVFLKTDLSSSTNPPNLPDLLDNLHIVLDVDVANILTESEGSSAFSSPSVITSGANNNEIDVIGTKFLVHQQPEPIEGQNISLITNPIIEVRGDNNNLDLDYSGSYSISTPVGGATIDISGITDDFNGDGRLNLHGLLYTNTGDGTLTITDPNGILLPTTTNNVDVINTEASLLTVANGITQNTTPLNAGSVNKPIFGFVLEAKQNTPNAPTLQGVTIRFEFPGGTSSPLSDIFSNFRLFIHEDGTLNPTNFFRATDITTVTTVSADAVTFSSLNQVLDEDLLNQYFYLVVDIEPGASASTPPVRAYLSSTDILPSSGSTSTPSGNPISGLLYNFNDSKNPAIISLSPTDDNITVDINTDFTITFDEAVTSLDGQLTLRKQGDNSFNETVPLTATSSDNRTFTFTPSTALDVEEDYYINIAPGNSTNATGFIDNSNNPFAGIQNATTWNFRTADQTPPAMSAITISGLYDQGFNFSLQLNEQGTVYYVVVDHTAVGFDPNDLDTFNEIQGYSSGLQQGSFFVSLVDQDYNIYVGDLSAGQNFTVYAIAEDLGGVQMTSPVISIPGATTIGVLPGTVVSGPTANVCIGDPQPLTTPILIREGANNDFKATNGPTVTYTLGFNNSNITFDTSQNPTITIPTASDLSNVTTNFINNTLLRITYDISGTANRDYIVIDNLYVTATSSGGTATLTRVGGTAIQTDNSETDGNVHATLQTVTSSIGADFSIDPPEIAFSNQDQTIYDLIADPSLILGTNEFSGPGVIGNLATGFRFNPQGTNIGPNDITLTHTDQYGCRVSTIRSLTVFDGNDPIEDLEDVYCADIALAKGINIQTIRPGAKDGFTLEQLTVSVDPGAPNPGYLLDPDVLVKNGADWAFDINLAGQNISNNGDSIVVVRFDAKYRSNFDASDSLLVSKEVFIAETPVVNTALFNNGPEQPDQYCEDGELIRVEGDYDRDKHTEGLHQFTLLSTSQTGLTDNGDGTADLNPSLRGVGTYLITYHFTNGLTGCSNSDTLALTINPKPVANFQTSPGCVDDEYSFIPNSTIDNSIIPTAAVRDYNWTFDDNNAGAGNPNTSTEPSPTHTYSFNGNYSVELVVTSEVGCTSDITDKAIEIGENPVPNFAYQQIGQDAPTTFSIDESTIVLAASEIAEVQWLLDNRDGSSPTSINNTSTVDVPFTFDTPGIKDVYLTIVSHLGCDSTVQDSLFIVPVENLTSENTYNATFETGAQGWIPWGTNNSWIVGDTGGDVISESIDVTSGRSQFWVSGNSTYDENQQSYVYSPIFDLTALPRPLIKMDIFNHMNSGDDGVVLEYSTTGLFGEWKILGELESGINWYETRDISSSAGDTNPTNLGWSLADSTWREAKHTLSILNGNRVQFRVAFSSGPNTTSHSFNGFAFDNVFIGQRTRTVLIENFTNMNGPSIVNSEATFLRNFPTIPGSEETEVIKINYHTDFPQPDLLNTTNRVDPSARALFYNIDEVPRAIIDGLRYENDPFSVWGEQAFGLRTLALADFDIEMSAVTSGGQLQLTATLTPALPTRTNNLIVTAAILEKTVLLQGQTYHNVLRKLLPNAAGIKINATDLQPGVALAPLQYDWSPTTVEDLSNMAAVIFVQDEMTKEIYQAEILSDIPAPDRVTGLAPGEQNEQIMLYPNPVHNQLNILLPTGISAAHIILYDTFGKIVYKAKAESNTHVIDTQHLSAGLYHLQLENNHQVIRKRVLVVHRER